jgi:hypothetical protein
MLPDKEIPTTRPGIPPEYQTRIEHLVFCSRVITTRFNPAPIFADRRFRHRENLSRLEHPCSHL